MSLTEMQPSGVVNRLDEALAERRSSGSTALILFITAGYPDLATTARLIPALAAAGADAIELGMPFSDPLADGPTIQRAAALALRTGLRLPMTMAMVADQRRAGISVPLLLLSYVNPLLANGLLSDAGPLRAAGFDGLIVPDVPSLESSAFEPVCQAAGLHWIPFLAPTSTEAQLTRVAQGQGGFVYCVSVTGVTGTRDRLPDDTVRLLQWARSRCRRPVAVGFGVSGPEEARRLAAHADAIIVGSALAQRIEAAVDAGEDPVAAAVRFTRQLRHAVDGR